MRGTLIRKSTPEEMTILRCCLLFAVVIFALQQFVASQFLIDNVLLPGVNNGKGQNLAIIVYKFAVDLYEEFLRSDEDSNVFFSPISIYIALATIYEGSIEETKRQLASILQPMAFYGEDDFFETIKRLLNRLRTGNKTFPLTMASRFYSQVGVNISDGYKKLMKDYFDAGVQSIDFKTDPSQSRSEINNWVQNETTGKIRNLFPGKATTNNVDFALANAVYFKGSWLKKFHLDTTELDKFIAPGNVELRIDMMHLDQPEEFLYASDNKTFKLVELPYSNKNFSMVIVLEEKSNGFKEFLREKLQGESPKVKLLRLSLPKINLQQTMNLQETLQVLGIKNLFQTAQFTGGIAGSAPLKFTDAYRKTFLDVFESGTDAAQSIGFEAAMPRSDSANYGFQNAPSNRNSTVQRFVSPKDDGAIEFNVDRPFLIFVFEKTTGGILFLGHIKNPLRTN